MKLPEPRAVLWDMDGTIIHSAEYHWVAWRDVMRDEGYALTYDEFAQTFGQRNDTIIRRYFGSNISRADSTRIAETKEAHYRHLVRTRGITLLPGAQHWFDYLKAHGWRQAIASAAPRQNIDTILDVLNIDPYFDALVSAEDVQRGKPDPQVFHTAASRVQVPAPHCIVVEDAPAGIEGAHRAQMRAIGLRTTHSELVADRVFDSLDELPGDVFDQLLRERRTQ